MNTQAMLTHKTSLAIWECLRYLAIVAVAVTASSYGSPATAQPPAYLPTQALPGATNLDVVLVIDQSGSMWERNDPPTTAADGARGPGWRIVAANLLAEWLATDQSGAQHQLSVVMFGTEAKVVIPLREIQSAEAQAAFKQAIAAGNQPMGGTEILKALQLAKGELDKGRNTPGTRRAVIFLSDGKCEPVADTSDAQRQQCEQDIRKLVQRDFVSGTAGSIFTIALMSDAFKHDPANQIYKNLWQEISVTTGGDYFEPAQASGELLDAFVKILQQLFGLPIQSPPAPVDAPVELSYNLPADLLQVGFTLIKDGKDISMTVTRPDSTVVLSTDAGTRHSRSDWTESYNISKPPAGTWKVSVSGNGKVIVLNVPFEQRRFVIDRAQPAAAHPQGKPMDIRARVLDADQAPLSPRDMSVEVTLPDGASVRLPMSADGDTRTALLADTSQTGAYGLRFAGIAQDTPFSNQQTVKVVTAPWLRAAEPQSGAAYPANLAIPVRAQVMLNSQAMGPLNPGDQLEVVARLVSSNGRVIDTQFLRPWAGGIYSGTLNPYDAGAHAVQLTLSYTPASGEKFEDITTLPITLTGLPAALVVPATAIAPTTVPTPFPTRQDALQRVSLVNDFNLLYWTLGGLGAVILICTLILAVLLAGIRRDNRAALAHQTLSMRSQRARELSDQMQAPHGWQEIAAQILADTLGETAAVDGDAGVLDVSALPCPKLTLVTCDGHEVVFTTDPRLLRRMKLIRRRDRVIDVSALSAARHTDAGMLWLWAMDARGFTNVAVPSTAHWHIVVRIIGARTAGLRRLWHGRNPFPRIVKAPQGGR